MALATKCPYCQTAFRVANDQLKLHAGLVRCGSCQQTFNGIEHLLAPVKPPVTAINPVETEAVAAASLSDAELSLSTANISTASISQEEKPAATEQTSAEGRINLLAAAAGKAAQAEINPAATSAKTSEATPPAETSTTPSEVKPEVSKTSEILEFNLDLDSDSEADAETDTDNLKQQLQTLDASIAELSEESADSVLTINSPVSQAGQDNSDSFAEENTDREPSLDTQLLAQLPLEQEVWETKDLNAATEHHDPAAPDVSSSATDKNELSQESALHLSSVNAEFESASGLSEADHLSAEDADKPSFVVQAEKKQRRGKMQTIFMSVASLILLLTAVAQGSYYFRNQIAAHLPQTKFYLLQACQYLQCKIELPTQINLIVIDSNELLPMVDEGNLFSLIVQLQNKSSVVQAWPHLELSLNDEKDKLVLKKTFLPHEYLHNPADLAKGFNANTDLPIKLYFELSDNKAAGYNLAVFYP